VPKKTSCFILNVGHPTYFTLDLSLVNVGIDPYTMSLMEIKTNAYFSKHEIEAIQEKW
jgi:hypothetical protein